ncbi:hypothetical protein BST81_24225 [Leptolyngbya sp. 'hensonii']|nr:hypothetical protein BST81_24225 [Leptolyngbya sp. 'hensonii']
MNLERQINRQRVKHIVSSYQLDATDAKSFHSCLDELLQTYPTPLIELALVEVLVESWLSFPRLRGLDCLRRVQDKLIDWEGHPIVSTITPEQFYQIAGLDPHPIFGSAEPVLVQLESA